MEILDSGRLVGVEPVPAASDQESGELVLAPGKYVDVEVRVPPPNLTRFVALVFDQIRSDGHQLLLSFFANAEYYLRAQGHKATGETWHKRLGHPSQSTLNNTIKAAVLDKNSLLLPNGLELKPVNRPAPCTICPAANLPHEPFPTHFPGADDCQLMDKYRPPTAPLGKFDQRAKWGLHLGIEKQYFAWRIMDYRSRLLVPARDCIFYENLTMPVFEQHLASHQNPAMLFHGVRSFANVDVELAASEEPDSDDAREATPDPPVPVTSSGIPEFIPLANAALEDVREVHHTYLVDEQRQPMPDVSDSTIRVNLDEIGGASGDHNDSVNFAGRTDDNLHYQTGLQILGLATAVQYSSTVNLEPKTARQALSGPHRKKWREAMDRELDALEKRGTWDLIPIEKMVNKNVLTGKWVFRVKTKADGIYEKHKARWVVRGFDQTHGIDYTLTFAPVSRHTSPVQSQSLLQPVSPLPAPSPYTGPTGGLAERREPASRPASPVRAARTSGRAPRQRPPAVPRTHQMALRPSTASQRVPLPSPPASSLPVLADPESDSLRAASPTVARLLSTVVTDPSFESAAASALVAELSASVCPPSVGGECALSTDVLEDRQEEFQCFAAALPHLVSMLIAPEGDPDAPDIPSPRSYAEAIEGPYSSQWQSAMDAEMASWKSTGTYVDEVPPPGANIVSGMWIFRVKRPPGSPPVFKARYVARGFSQRQGVDYFHTFSPTPKMSTLRVLLHVAAQRDYELHSLDFNTAFLQGSLHEEIWLRRPPGFTGSFPPGTQWSLRRPVYGLRQAPRERHDTLRTTLAALGFAPSTADPSLFLRTDTSLPPFYILVYVDDLVFATADTAGLANVKSELQKRHTCTDLGELRSYLGLQITRDRAQRTITLTQSHMVQQVLQRFDFTYSLPQATPLSTRHSLSALPSDESVEPSGPYPELVGCLMYLMTCTRPDLAYPLSILARYVAPGRHRPEHMAAAKRVLRYLCSTSGLGLVLGGRLPVVLTGHADASWADDQTTQRSSQGYTFSLGSGSVSWRSTRSSSVLGSSCEAEIYAGAMAAQELRWLTYLLTNLGEQPRSPPVLYVDIKAMLALCREHRLEHRTKHIALRYFLARELQQRGQLRLAYVASQANTADIFTKALPPGDHQRFCTMLGLVPTWPHLLTS
ncbi:unnamed protein product [Closterium sp. NIES-53]